MILGKIKSVVRLIMFKISWKKANHHNNTRVVGYFDTEKVSVGKHTYGPLNVVCYGNSDEKLFIGNYCSISMGVKFLLGGEHHPEYIMNYPFKLYMTPEDDIADRRTRGAITIGDDVWIGTDATILSGVNIGQGAIIAAGSIVTKDVPPYAIYTTNRIIRYRFSQDIIDKLLKIDMSKLNFEFVRENIDLFYSEDIEAVLEKFELLSVMENSNFEEN